MIPFQFDQNFNFLLRRDHQKNSYERPLLRVGRRQEPLLSFIAETDGKNNSGDKGLIILHDIRLTKSGVSDAVIALGLIIFINNKLLIKFYQRKFFFLTHDVK